VVDHCSTGELGGGGDGGGGPGGGGGGGEPPPTTSNVIEPVYEAAAESGRSMASEIATVCMPLASVPSGRRATQWPLELSADTVERSLTRTWAASRTVASTSSPQPVG